MKRSVAIVGPTPAFLEWSIAQECRLRDLDVEQPVDLPSQTFRQLRSVRELGVGRVEGRVFEGTCVHADVLVQLNDSIEDCLLYTSPSPRDATLSRMPSSA